VIDAGLRMPIGIGVTIMTQALQGIRIIDIIESV